MGSRKDGENKKVMKKRDGEVDTKPRERSSPMTANQRI